MEKFTNCRTRATLYITWLSLLTVEPVRFVAL